MVYSSPEVVSGPDDGYTLVAWPTAQNPDPKVQAQSRMADAHLIAAAPDMLEALDAISPMLPRSLATTTHGDPVWTEAIRKVESAIKKARGGE